MIGTRIKKGEKHYMGAMVTVIYDTAAVSKSDVNILSGALKDIIINAISDKDVFVYVSSPEKVFGADPVEVFVQVNSQKTADPGKVLSAVAKGVTTWKASSGFAQKLNLNVIPVEWYSQINL